MNMDFLTYEQFTASKGLPRNLTDLDTAKVVHREYRAQLRTGLLSEILKIDTKDPLHIEYRNKLVETYIFAYPPLKAAANFESLTYKDALDPKQFVELVVSIHKEFDDMMEGGQWAEKDAKMKQADAKKNESNEIEDDAPEKLTTLGTNNKFSSGLKTNYQYSAQRPQTPKVQLPDVAMGQAL